MPNFSKIFPTAFLLRKKLFSQQKIIAISTHPQNYLSYYISYHPEMAGLIKFRMAYWFYGLPRWCSVERSTYQYRRCKKHRFEPWVSKIPWGRKWQPTPLFLSEKFQGQRSLVDYSSRGHKGDWMNEHSHTHIDSIIAPVEKQLWKDGILSHQMKCMLYSGDK